MLGVMEIMRYFVPLASGIQLHYRRAGNGPPVILLHPSPQSSTFSLPMLRRLSSRFTAIAVDTPGYGLSDALPGEPGAPELIEYVEPLRQFLDALGIRRAAFYGNATGAEILHLFAHAHPERVALCMIDTAGHKEDADLDAMLQGYFPDVTPRRDGGHLLTHWDMVRSLSLFSPWHKTDAAHRLPIDLPAPDVLQVKLLDYLRAGRNYAAAYRPAFYTAKHALISRVTVPATLMRWEGKPDLSEQDELIARGLPPNFTVLHAGPTLDERYAANERHLVEHYLPQDLPTPPPPPQLDPTAPRLQKMMVQVPGGQLFARACLAGSGRAIFGLPDAIGASRCLVPLLSQWLGCRPVFAIDHPGAGESDALLSAGEISVAEYARHAHAAMLQLVGGDVDLVGLEAGGQVAQELALLEPSRVRHVVQLRPVSADPARRAELIERYAPSIAPRWDGSHLVTAWAVLRDMELFDPWYARTGKSARRRDAAIDAGSLDARVEDLLKIGDGWGAACIAAFNYPQQERRQLLEMPCMVAQEATHDAIEAFMTAVA
jgi:pimeloyl-ACP methyl ester carboxylesterase